MRVIGTYLSTTPCNNNNMTIELSHRWRFFFFSLCVALSLCRIARVRIPCARRILSKLYYPRDLMFWCFRDNANAINLLWCFFRYRSLCSVLLHVRIVPVFFSSSLIRWIAERFMLATWVFILTFLPLSYRQQNNTDDLSQTHTQYTIAQRRKSWSNGFSVAVRRASPPVIGVLNIARMA